MTPNSIPRFLGWLERENTPVLYARTLEVQSELMKSDIRAALKALPAWRLARTVLDVGCGPGSFPHRFKGLLSSKRYLGIDREAFFIKEARRKVPESSKVEFLRSDLFDFTGRRFDLIYLWAVAQHLPSASRMLRHLRTLLNPGGHILIFDTHGREDVNLKPDVGSVRSMYERLGTESPNKGRHIDCILEIKRQAEKFGYRVDFEESVRVPIASIGDKRLFIRYVGLFSELIERFYSIQSDRKKILEDLVHWSSIGRSSAVLGGGQWLLLSHP